MNDFQGIKTNSTKKSSISDKIWKEIEKEDLKPIPKWRWQVQELFLWLAFLLMTILGSISFALILLELFNGDWNWYTYLTDSFLEYLFAILPYFWITLLCLLLLLASYLFFYTKSAYKYSYFRVLLYSTFISLLLGFVLYFTNLSLMVDELVRDIIPQPHFYIVHRYELWNKVDEGLLAGRIVKVINAKRILLEDLHKHQWLVEVWGAKVFNPELIRLGSMIKLIGFKLEDGVFKAQKVYPWRRPFREKIKTIQKDLHNFFERN